MVTINSVIGKIDSSQLGCTLIHEHLRIRSESVSFQFPHLYDTEEEFQLAIEQVNAAKKCGVKSICDPTVMELGRDIRFMERVARETDIQVIAATGIYSLHYIPLRFQTREPEYMAELFVRDIEIGVQNTSIKAGFLKCATDVQGITPDVEKVLRAVAIAHHKTGVPIMTHSHAKSYNGLLQIEILQEEGVNPKNILIGHCGDSDELDYLERILDSGAYIGMDRYGLTKLLSTERRNSTLLELVKRGYTDRMFLSQDYCCTSEQYTPETKKATFPKWSMTYLFDEVIPDLKKEGVTEDQVHTLMFENPHRWFSGN